MFVVTFKPHTISYVLCTNVGAILTFYTIPDVENYIKEFNDKVSKRKLACAWSIMTSVRITELPSGTNLLKTKTVLEEYIFSPVQISYLQSPYGDCFGLPLNRLGDYKLRTILPTYSVR